MFKYFRTVIIIILCFILTGCLKENEKLKNTDGLSIVTSFYPIYAMTKTISGELNDIRMIQSNAGIHSFEPSVNDVAAIYDADVFIYHSHTLESWAGDLDPSLENSTVKVIEASNGLKLDKVEGLEDITISEGIDPDALYDPHTWTDPYLVSEEAMLIAKALGQIDPDNSDYYNSNAKQFKEEVKKIAEEYHNKFKTVKSKTFITQHTAFHYLAKRFNLKQLGISGISPEQEPTPRQLTEIKNFIEEYKIKTIFTEDNVNPKLANVIANSTGSKIKVLSPLESPPNNNKTYLENLKENLEILYQNLK